MQINCNKRETPVQTQENKRLEKNVNGFILAAGIGSRLRPLTDTTPKALIEVNGICILERVLSKMEAAGISKIVVNVHHLADKVEEYLSKRKNTATVLISDEREKLLETGGGLKKAQSLFDKDAHILIYNADIISNIDLPCFINEHMAQNALASLATKSRTTSRSLLKDSKNLLCGWRHNETGEEIISRNITPNFATAFSGIHIVKADIFPLLTEKGAFSITKSYLRLAENHIIYCFNHDNDIWLDIGNEEKLKNANEIMEQFNFV